jgi:hypothetical protein
MLGPEKKLRTNGLAGFIHYLTSAFDEINVFFKPMQLQTENINIFSKAFWHKLSKQHVVFLQQKFEVFLVF